MVRGRRVCGLAEKALWVADAPVDTGPLLIDCSKADSTTVVVTTWAVQEEAASSRPRAAAARVVRAAAVGCIMSGSWDGRGRWFHRRSRNLEAEDPAQPV